jgi:hypothetical protein
MSRTCAHSLVSAFFLARDFAILSRDYRRVKLRDGFFRQHSDRLTGRERIHIDVRGLFEQLDESESLVDIGTKAKRAVVLKYVAMASIGELARDVVMQFARA